jgi:hypothetical protein
VVTPLESAVLRLSKSHVGTREQGQNHGPEIARWQAFCGAKPGDPYCACWVCYVVHHAAAGLVGVTVQLKKSAGALRLVEKNPDLVITRDEAVALMRAVRPVIAVFDHGKGKGHVCFGVGLVGEECFKTYDPNTGPGPSVPKTDRDGQGVYEREDRRIDSVHGWMRLG